MAWGGNPQPIIGFLSFLFLERDLTIARQSVVRRNISWAAAPGHFHHRRLSRRARATSQGESDHAPLGPTTKTAVPGSRGRQERCSSTTPATSNIAALCGDAAFRTGTGSEVNLQSRPVHLLACLGPLSRWTTPSDDRPPPTPFHRRNAPRTLVEKGRAPAMRRHTLDSYE